jgi:SpoVK/Ycf46/Vps4 family AAA+-type ATPase
VLVFVPVSGTLHASELTAVRSAVVASLRGRRLAPELVGQTFKFGAATLQLVDVRKEAQVLEEGDIEIRAGHASVSSRHLQTVAKLRDEIGDFVRELWLVTADAPEAELARREYNQLVETPKEEVLLELEASLRPPQWISDWSRVHYGGEIAAASLLRARPALVVLAGEPGTGKSATARSAPYVLAERLTEPILFVQLNDRIRGEGIQGRAGTDLARVFDAIADVAESDAVPAMVFLDEAEGVAATRGSDDFGSGAQENVAIVDALIVAIDTVARRPETRVVFVMATNLIARLDPAIVRRGTVFPFERPTRAARMELLVAWLADLGLSRHDLTAIDRLLHRLTPPPTASDLLHRMIVPIVHGCARRGEPISLAALEEAAKCLIPTPPADRST